ncbi:hypothetical protein [Vitreimonas sp.]|uniref:hypothetical protein n=1 Tax=Vitreimonas sp. TaxID=3069702 RepID=UPI002EDB5F0E
MRVTFWGGHGSAALIVEADGRKVCHVLRHPEDSPAADEALVTEAAANADLLVFPGSLDSGLTLKERAGAHLLALGCGQQERSADELNRLGAEAAQESPNVFFARRKMSLDL